MEIKEPKKKFSHQQRDLPLPLTLDNDKKKIIQYTAHLSTSGTCIVHPDEIKAVYHMGYFGKGSLSRNVPKFGKRLFGAPPLIRERQWKRRKMWIEQSYEMSADNNIETSESANQDEQKKSSEPVDENKQKELSESVDQDNPSTNKEINNQQDLVELSVGKNQPEASCSNVNDNKTVNISINKSQELSDTSIEIISENYDEKKSNETCFKKTDNIKTNKNNDNKNLINDKIDDEIDEVILDSTDDEISEINANISEDDENFNENDQSNFSFDTCHDSIDININVDNKNEVIVIPDSDDEDIENYMNNIKPRIETNGFPMAETLQLTFEETFFLMYGLGCLQLVNYDSNLLTIIDAWNYFNQQDKYFLIKYIVYHYYRSKGWIVKNGIKFGGDYLLYKDGPPFYHASYVVVIDVAEADTLARIESKSSRQFTWNSLHAKNRIVNTLGKEMMIVNVLWPSSISINTNNVPLESLSEFTVRETLIRRWNPEQKNDEYDDDEYSENDDST